MICSNTPFKYRTKHQHGPFQLRNKKKLVRSKSKELSTTTEQSTMNKLITPLHQHTIPSLPQYPMSHIPHGQYYHALIGLLPPYRTTTWPFWQNDTTIHSPIPFNPFCNTNHSTDTPSPNTHLQHYITTPVKKEVNWRVKCIPSQIGERIGQLHGPTVPRSSRNLGVCGEKLIKHVDQHRDVTNVESRQWAMFERRLWSHIHQLPSIIIASPQLYSTKITRLHTFAAPSSRYHHII